MTVENPPKKWQINQMNTKHVWVNKRMKLNIGKYLENDDDWELTHHHLFVRQGGPKSERLT